MKKMGVFSLLYYLLYFKIILCENYFFILFGDECVTNSTSAISSNFEIESYEKENHASKIYYKDKILDTNTYVENFEIWSQRKSLEENKPEFITDYRWEFFDTIYTRFNGESLYYNNILTFDSFNKEIPLSIRSQYEAHIYLCDGKTPPTSNCYWILLGGNAGNKTALRKCKVNEIGYNYMDWPKSPCKDFLVQKHHNTSDNPILNEDLWFHFKIILNHNRITLLKGDEEIITYSDNSGNPFKITNLIVHTKRKSGYWKLHSFDYSYTTEISGKNIYKFYFYKGLNCVSMFIKMCTKCSIIFQFVEQYYNSPIHTEEFISVSKWKEIKMHFNIQNTNYYHLKAFTILNDPVEKNHFWAIDNVRKCAINEYRKIESKNAPCQLLSENHKILENDAKSDNISSKHQIDCDDKSFGKNCIPCDMFFSNPYCTNKKYCELNGNSTICHCVAGFTGKKCGKPCPSGTFGHSCRHSCPNCENKNCDNFGTCRGRCINGFSGISCEISPRPVFVSPPEIVREFETEVVVKQTKFQLKNQRETKLLKFYLIQHKETASQEWISDEKRQFSDNSEIIIKNLKPDTDYSVRAIINCENKPECSLDVAELNNFHTKCYTLQESDVNLIATNTSANLTFQAKNCNNNNYEIRLLLNNKLVQGPIRPHNSYYNFLSLKPFTNYFIEVEHIVFKHKISKAFSTTEGMPSEIENLKYESSYSTIDLKWNPPFQPNGIINKYEVRYKFLYKSKCNHNFNQNNKVVVSINPHVTLNELMPYSCYEISIKASNRLYFGKTETKIICTLNEDEISQNEYPKLNITSTETQIAVKLRISCELLNGPLFYYAKITCNNEWCFRYNNNQLYSIKSDKHEIFFTGNIQPFSNYTVEIRICRDKNILHKSCVNLYEHVSTKSSIPPMVKSLNVYTKNKDSVSIRWMPPYPPKGKLKQYKITIDNNYEYYIDPKECKLWTDFHCATFKIPQYYIDSYDLSIYVYAFNENVNKTNQPAQLTVTLNVLKPEKPYDLVISPNHFNNIVISWKHPNNTNGPLKKFIIKLKHGYSQFDSFAYNINSEDDYNLTYTQIIENNVEKCCTHTEISVISVNDQSESEPATKNYFLPPFIGDIQNITEAVQTNDTITLKIPSIQVKSGTNSNILVFLNEAEEIKEDLSVFTTSRTFSYRKSLKIYNDEKWSTFPLEIILGDNSTLNSNYFSQTIWNEPLESNTIYHIVVMIINKCNNEIGYKLTEFVIKTDGSSASYILSYIPIILGVFACFAILLIIISVRMVLKKYPTIISDSMRAIRVPHNFSQDDLILDDLPRENQTAVLKPAVRKGKKPLVDVFPTHHSKPIRISEFEAYLKNALLTSELQKQHNLFPRGQTKPWVYGIRPENKSKNRYNNLIAYDHTRVILEKINNDPFSDYINANYIDGYKVKRAYIATQGPKSSTLYDFWRMIVQENVYNIIMLANIMENGKKKVEKYWPDINEELNFNEISIKFLSHEIFANFEYRIFIVSCEDVERKVNHLHFTSWPDHGVPLYPESLVPFLQKILKIPNSTRMPIVVHCSAGVGRTGTIIICDICLRMAASEGRLDFLSTLEHIRSQRPNLVDNVEQYKLAHLAVLSCLRGMNTTILCNDDMDAKIHKIFENGTILTQMKYLQDTVWQDEAMKTVAYSCEDLAVFPEKNRSSTIIPENIARIFISRYPLDDESSSYINAVLVDGFSSPGRYIVTQQPLPNTLGDFWRLVAEKNSTVIISLNDINLKDGTCCKFWPDEETPQIQPVDYITLKYRRTTGTSHYSLTTIEMCLYDEEAISVDVISLQNCWPANEVLPDISIQEFLAFWEESDSICRQSVPVVVTCYDGATASGLYLALSFSIEKMKLEQECDICQAVRYVRRNRKQFVTHEEQFEFLYKASLKYIKGFQQYANFN